MFNNNRNILKNSISLCIRSYTNTIRSNNVNKVNNPLLNAVTMLPGTSMNINNNDLSKPLDNEFDVPKGNYK